MNVKRYHSFALFLALVLALLGVVPSAFAQASEVELNNTCSDAHDLGAVSSQFIVDGILSSGDIDFFKFQEPPSTYIQVDLSGAGAAPLGDPLLGFFDSNCKLLSYNDDNNSANSGLTIKVPANGIVILAATGYDDFGFNGSHVQSGAYQLTLVGSTAKTGSISGRVVDAKTNNPVPTWSWVDLLQCSKPDDTSSCYWVDGAGTNDDRIFSFTGKDVGTYLVVAHADYYQDSQSGLFTVGEGEDHYVGDIALTPNPSIGSISGRVVDTVSGVGLSGQEYPFVYVYLNQCEYWGCWGVSGTQTDSEGRFTFSSFGQFAPGNYEVVVTAQDYQQAQKEVSGILDGENRDIGNIPLALNPIKFSEVRPCGSLPAEGGTCRYSARVTNQSGKQLSGAAWSIVSSSDLQSLAGDTTFQTATPVKLTLKPGASRVVSFQFYVPSTVRQGTNICADALFGQDSNQPYFNLQGRRNLLCIGKGVTSFSLLSKQESQTLSRERQHPPKKGLKPAKSKR